MDMSRHPSAPGSKPTEAPACAGAQATPNLPALLTALPGDATRATQTEFTRARQVLFLENLSVTGSVRSAASAAQVSHQTAYRARRATPAFRTAWDAALVVARAAAADTLACRAIDGVEEKVFYHGEEIATRTRYSDRLLLAHLARLDKLVDNPGANAFAEDFDTALARFAAGEAPLSSGAGEPPLEVPASAGTRFGDNRRAPAQAGASLGGSPIPENLSPGPCNTRSMSNTPVDGEWDEDDGIDWEDEEACKAELARIEAAMEAERPADAPRLDADDPHGLIADAQWEEFQRKVPRWWLVVNHPQPLGSDAWRYAEVDPETDADAEAAAQPEIEAAVAADAEVAAEEVAAETEPARAPASGDEPEQSSGDPPSFESEPEPEPEPAPSRPQGRKSHRA